MVHVGAHAFFGVVHLVPDGIEDEGRKDFAILFHGNGNGPVWNAMQVIVGSIQRVDDETFLAGFMCGVRLAFFHEEGKARTGLLQFALQDLLRVFICR